MAAQISHYRGRPLWLQRCNFGTVESPFSLTTVAQNIPVFLRKSPLHKKYFFEWLKTAVLLFDCGTVTLKSLLSLRSDAPHVHLRPRKRLSRCTLDCGFKTSESPALRGFVGGPRALATAALYLAFFFVLEKAVKSAGNAVISTLLMHRSYGLQGSLKRRYKHPSPTSINGYHTAKKFLSQSPAKRPTFAFTGESGLHTRLCSKDRTHGLTRRNRWRFGWGWYHYPRSVSHGSETLRGQVSERQTLPLLRLDPVCSRRTQRAFGTAMRLCASLSRRRRGPAGLRGLFATW